MYTFLKKTRKTSRRETKHTFNSFRGYQMHKDFIKYEEEA